MGRGWITLAAVVSWGGLWYHELVRVPSQWGFTWDGDLFMLAILIAILVWWWVTHSKSAVTSLLVYGAVNLVGGLLSVLPDILRFTVQFSDRRYSAHLIAHAVFAAAQLPLIAVSYYVRLAIRRDEPSPARQSNQSGDRPRQEKRPGR